VTAEDVVRELFGIWNDGRVEQLARCLAPVVDHDGRSETLEEMAEWHRREHEVWAGTTHEIVALVSDGSSVAVRWRATATHVGTWGPVPATGRTVSWDGVHFLTVSDRRVTSLWAMADMFAKAQQLGVVMTASDPGRPPD
jgi:predicted ester cyclase